MDPVPVAVIGAGVFGRHHLRVLSQLSQVRLVAVVDRDPERALAAGRDYGIPAFTEWRAVVGRAQAAIIAVPTAAHAEVACGLLEAGLDVLVEKPIADCLEAARQIVDTAQRHGRILNVGHVESFNPAVERLRAVSRFPLFFEIHRLSPFSPRSLDVDVVLDLMIHDIEIVLSLVGERPEEVRAAGIAVLTEKVDIANARLGFSTGCVANLTASRVSPQRVRKLRMFQPHEYLSVDYQRQDVLCLKVGEQNEIVASQLPVERSEPLRRELESFVDSVRTRRRQPVTGEQALQALEVALEIVDRIKEHGERVKASLQRAATH